MNSIFANTNLRSDFLGWELEKAGRNTDVHIAVAFFTEYNLIKKLVDNGCTVRLIVRLSFPTNPHSLQNILHLKNVYIRYFTAHSFHPKLYIFTGKIAFVGSSNLTDSGLISNQEINVAIDNENPAFEALEEVFSEYWEQATPLTKDTLENYLRITSAVSSEIDKLNRQAQKDIEEKIGKVEFSNIKRGNNDRKSQSKLISDILLKRYQLFLGEFINLREVYKSVGKRKLPESTLPLRIEIDQFLSWIREEKAYGKLCKEAPRRREKELDDFVVKYVNEFLTSEYEYIDYLANEQFPTINANLSSAEVIEAWTETTVAETVLIVHAFASRARYFGGKSPMVRRFIDDNGLDKIKKTFTYLLFGRGEFTHRIGVCVTDPKYKLKHFGQSCIQEIYGWANDADIPICNERTFKSMQWLGYGEM